MGGATGQEADLLSSGDLQEWAGMGVFPEKKRDVERSGTFRGGYR